MIRWIQEIRALSKRISKARVDAYAAQSAFYLIMGFIPFIMLLMTLLQYTAVTKNDVMELLMQILPVSFQGLVEDVVSEIYVKSTTVISLSAVASVWACGRSVLAITNGLNSVNGLQETRNYLFRRIRSGFYVVIILLALVLALVLFVFGNRVHDILIERLIVLQKFSNMLIGIRTAGTIIALSLLMAAIYTFLPNRRRKFRSQLPGAAATALSWSLFSYAFSVYLELRTEAVSIYGSLTTVVMLMLWLYFCMWLIFFGAMLNVILEEKTGKRS